MTDDVFANQVAPTARPGCERCGQDLKRTLTKKRVCKDCDRALADAAAHWIHGAQQLLTDGTAIDARWDAHIDAGRNAGLQWAQIEKKLRAPALGYLRRRVAYVSQAGAASWEWVAAIEAEAKKLGSGEHDMAVALAPMRRALMLDDAASGRLEPITGAAIVLEAHEELFYRELASYLKRNRQGTYTVKGVVHITNQRLIFMTGGQGAFETRLSKVFEVQPEGNKLHIGSSTRLGTYWIAVPDAEWAAA